MSQSPFMLSANALRGADGPSVNGPNTPYIVEIDLPWTPTIRS